LQKYRHDLVENICEKLRESRNFPGQEVSEFEEMFARPASPVSSTGGDDSRHEVVAKPQEKRRMLQNAGFWKALGNDRPAEKKHHHQPPKKSTQAQPMMHQHSWVTTRT
jgi:hypothetical protein